MKGKEELPVLNGELIIGEAKVAFEPIEKCWLKDPAAAIKGIASEPNQFGPVKAARSSLVELFAKLADVIRSARRTLTERFRNEKEALVRRKHFQMNWSIRSL